MNNIKDKITWMPNRSGWKLQVQQLKHKKKIPFTDFVEVDSELRGEDFQKMKAHKYVLAVNEWNKCDTSTRPRIPAIDPQLLNYIQSEQKTIDSE